MLKTFNESLLIFGVCVRKKLCNCLNFFLFLLLFLLIEKGKVFLEMFHHSLPRKRVTKIGLISLDTLKKVCTEIVP